MADILFTITNGGRAALINAANNGTNAVLIVSAGLSATAVTANPAMIGLPGEFKRVNSIAGDTVADDTIHLIIRDESTDVYSVRSVGLYLGDGTLFGIYGQAASILDKTAQSLMLLGVDVKFADINANSITFGNANFLNPPATTEREGVVELATLAEAKAGNDASRAITPATAKQSVTDWIGYAPVRRSGDSMSGSLAIEHAGSPTLTLNSAGVALGRFAMQSDGNLILYRNSGSGDVPVFHVASQSGPFNVGLPLTRQGNKVWDAANDGAGSGMDADLLDGLQGSAYALRSQNVTFADVTAMRSDGTGVVFLGSTDRYLRYAAPYYFLQGAELWVNGGKAWHSLNDGAGSGLDADLLDGQEGGFYSNIPARLGYTPANKAGEYFTGNVAIDFVGNPALTLNSAGVAIARFAMQNDGNFVLYRNAGSGDAPVFSIGSQTGPFAVQMPITRSGNRVWDAGNDGAGSGLDADLLDGQDGSYYANVAGRLGYVPANRAGDTFTGPIGRDAAYYFDFTNGNPLVNFDANDYLVFNRANDSLSLVIGGQQRIVSQLTGDMFLYAAGGIRFNSNSIWHAGNDGAGSGLDADLLDGQDGSYYSNVAGRLGYTPANRAGDNFTGNVSIDYVGSPSFSLNSAGVAIGRFVMQNDGNIVLYRNAGGGDAPVFSIGSQTGPFAVQMPITRSGYTVWDALNDGSGSGLDADLLDGMHASEFNRVASNLVENGGRRVHSDGYIEHWGVVRQARTNEGGINLPFPVPFPNECFGVSFTTIGTGNANGQTSFQEISLDRNGCTGYLQSDTGGFNDFAGYRWFARGR